LLTHYFFVFAWAAMVGWLLLYPGRASRAHTVAAAFLVVLVIAPWYLHLPDSLANWRVTHYWLNLRPGNYLPLLSVLSLPWSYFALQGVWGTVRWLDALNFAVFVALAVMLWRQARWRRLWSIRSQLMWFCVAGACLGPVLFDLWRGTYVVAVTRYASPGLPAALLLVALGLRFLSPGPRTLLAGLLVALALSAVARMHSNSSRAGSPFREVGQLVREHGKATDLVIVHSIPSGVAGVARSIEEAGTSPGVVGFASWVGQLRQRRVPEDLNRLAAGYQRIILVKIHEVGEPSLVEDWLREHTALERAWNREAATVLFFQPRR
jgi:hypothetical protein